MTATTVSRIGRRPISDIGDGWGDGWLVLAMALAAAALTGLMNASLVGGTLQGQLGDPDDAMRLVEVRAWLGGQPWFDMTATRLDPPLGSVLHWSRLVDLPLAAMIKLFGLFTDPTSAERMALVAVPALWLVALYAGVARLATLLVGPAGRLPMLLGMIFSGAALVQFGPGRVGHHAPETVALVWALGCAIAALDRRHAREALCTGILVALSLAMSLETLPFHVALIGTLVGFWIWRGADIGALLGWLGGGLLVALPFFFLLTVGPQHWLAPVCDAYGAAHLGAGLIGAAGLLVLASTSHRLPRPSLRFAAAIGPAVLAGAFVALAYPACLCSPFASVDPLVRELWLDWVAESLPLLSFVRLHPMIGAAVVCPVLLGLIGSFAATVTARGTNSLRFLLIAVLSGFGLALSFWQVRVLASVTPIALCGGVYLVVLLRSSLDRKGLRLAGKLAPAAILPFTSTAWALALPGHPAPNKDLTGACLSPGALAPLAGLPPATAVAPINSGSHLLMDTKLSVFAAPYHRNDDGNRYAFEVFTAAPEKAKAMLVERHVRFVITCPGMSSFDRLSLRAPQGLAAQLAASRTPDFLQERKLGPTPYRVYDVIEPQR